MVLNLSAFLGMVSLGYLADRFGLKRIIIAWLGLAAVLMWGFQAFASPLMIMVAIGLIGFTMEGGFIGIYVAAARIYPTLIRNTGVGWAIRRGPHGRHNRSHLRGLAGGPGTGHGRELPGIRAAAGPGRGRHIPDEGAGTAAATKPTVTDPEFALAGSPPAGQ